MKDGYFFKRMFDRHLHQMVGLANKLHVSILNAIVNHLRGELRVSVSVVLNSF